MKFCRYAYLCRVDSANDFFGTELFHEGRISPETKSEYGDLVHVYHLLTAINMCYIILNIIKFMFLRICLDVFPKIMFSLSLSLCWCHQGENNLSHYILGEKYI